MDGDGGGGGGDSISAEGSTSPKNQQIDYNSFKVLHLFNSINVRYYTSGLKLHVI